MEDYEGRGAQVALKQRLTELKPHAYSMEPGWIERLSSRKFRAAIAFYPPCQGYKGIVTVPTLVLVGELDDLTPAGPCRDMAEGNSRIGITREGGDRTKLRLVVYPGAFHGFDYSLLKPGRGHWMEYNERATAAAVEEVRTFLRRAFDAQ